MIVQKLIFYSVELYFNDYNIDKSDEENEFFSAVSISPSSVHIHPLFNKTNILSYNFALIHLPSDVDTVARGIQPVTLPESEVCTADSNYTSSTRRYDSCLEAMALGWTISTNGRMSTNLTKVYLGLQEFDYCQDRIQLPPGTGFSVDKFCGGGNDEDPKDRCPGDWGGPVVCSTPTDSHQPLHFLLGHYSYGDTPCGSMTGDKPGVYARLCPILPWLQTFIRAGNYEQPINLAGRFAVNFISPRCSRDLVEGADYYCGDLETIRYTYHHNIGKCIKFLGCIHPASPSGNNFESLAECEEYCPGRVPQPSGFTNGCSSQSFIHFFC